MARPLRSEFPGALYHVTARGNERRAIYRSDDDRRRFLATLDDIVGRFHLLLHTYVLMDNHYHLLIETLEANLGRAMHDLNGAYAQAFNRGHRRVGHLLQGRYQSPLVQRDAYLLELSRYIHLNPVRAGMVARADEYRWSSARAYLGRCPTPGFLTVAEVLGHFGGRVHGARRRYEAYLDEACRSPPRSPFDNLIAQTLLGDGAWVETMRARIDACLRSGRLPLDLSGELPAVHDLYRRPTVAQIVSAVAAVTRTAPGHIYRPHSRAQGRAVAIYLASKWAGLPQKDVGSAFGIRSFAVSKVIARVARAADSDRELRCLRRRLTSALDASPA
jgi:REP element-mobilizing transposase RayT